MRRILPAACAILAGLIVSLGILLPSPLFKRTADTLLEGVLILVGFAMLMGLVNIARTHTLAVVHGQHRFSSIVLLLALVATLALGVLTPDSLAVSWGFEYIYYPIQASLGALLAFASIKAAYRAFRLGSGDAIILLVSSLVMLFLQIPAATALWPRLAMVRDWIYAVPVMAGIRGMLLGVSLGIMATSLRILVAVDRPYVGE